MRYFFIMNPASQGGKSEVIIKHLLRILKNKNIGFEYILASCLEDACQLSRAANKQDYDVIVAVGGDGTINQVINGFFNEDGTRLSSAKMGVIHTGTSPDFCKSYRIPTEPFEALNTILHNHSKQIKVGKITLNTINDKCMKDQDITHSENKQTAFFGCCANIGIGAALARSANSGIRARIGDFTGTLLSLLKTLLIYKPTDLKIICDGEAETLTKLTNISLGKTRYIASGIKVNHKLPPDSEELYMLTVNNLKLKNIPACLKQIYSGRIRKNQDFIKLNYFRKMDIKYNEQNPEIEFDGDPQGYLPVRIEAAKDFLELLCEPNKQVIL